MDAELTRTLIERWRADEGSTFHTWFHWEERLKNFRSIRRGVRAVVEEIESGRFGNHFKGSSLETVVGAIAEQRRVFRGADHAFQWKPKLRIPDIYEDSENQRAFGAFLDACCCCRDADGVVAAIRQLDRRAIKGLGPAAANILYFLHPTLAPPCNTAIVRGYNALAGAKVKLGRWEDYLAMRAGILVLNEAHRDALSNDLGAVAGLLLDLGSGRYALPPADGSARGAAAWREALEAVRAESAAEARAAKHAAEDEHGHTEVQGWLRDLGHALGFDVWVASNDGARPYAHGRLDQGCLAALPAHVGATPSADSISLIDVLWFTRGEGRLAAAFEVEHTTSIYSGIVRMLDLALGVPDAGSQPLFLVAPDRREADVRAQLARPAFSRVTDLDVRFLSYGALRENREAMGRFGAGLKPLESVAKRLGRPVPA